MPFHLITVNRKLRSVPLIPKLYRVDEEDHQFGMDPRRLGYQQHPSLVSAGLIDYVPHHVPINLSTARGSDAEAAKKL